jgi:hypothetical protein
MSSFALGFPYYRQVFSKLGQFTDKLKNRPHIVCKPWTKVRW